jgi:hypothetical protein
MKRVRKILCGDRKLRDLVIVVVDNCVIKSIRSARSRMGVERGSAVLYFQMSVYPGQGKKK